MYLPGRSLTKVQKRWSSQYNSVCGIHCTHYNYFIHTIPIRLTKCAFPWFILYNKNNTLIVRTVHFHISIYRPSRSQLPCGLTCSSEAARLLRLRFRIPPGAWMSVSCECCVLSGRGLCDGLITRPEESYWLWVVVVGDLETLWMGGPWHTGGGGLCAITIIIIIIMYWPKMHLRK